MSEVEDFSRETAHEETSNTKPAVEVFTVETGEGDTQNVKATPLWHKEGGAANEKMTSNSSQRSTSSFNRMYEHIRQSLGDTKLAVHILVATFAVASWADLNGMWSELPQLTLQAPEQWTLPSYITLIGQVANIGPIMFVIVSSLRPGYRPKLEIWVSFAVIILSVVAAFLMAFFYDKTSYLAGEERSTALLVINFFLAFGDCTSSVCFYAFMSLLKPQYMASLLLGEGFSGLIPGVLALIQGAGDVICVNGTDIKNLTLPNGTEYNETNYYLYPMYEEPLFSVKVYFIIVSCIIACSAVAFVVLNQWSYCRSEFVDEHHLNLGLGVSSVDDDEKGIANGSYKSSHSVSNSYGALDKSGVGNYSDVDTGEVEISYVNGGYAPSKDSEMNEKGAGSHSQLSSSMRRRESANTVNGNLQGVTSDAYHTSSTQALHPDTSVSFKGSGSSTGLIGKLKNHLVPKLDNMSMKTLFFLLAILVVINMTATTFLPSIQTYTVLPYGLKYYHLTTTITQIANPVACFFAVFVLAENVWVIAMVTLLGECVVAYITYLAAMSPTPPLHGQEGGGEISVLLWILLTLLLIYAKVCVAGVLRKSGGRSALVWAGFVTQLGTAIGAVVGFLLVNHYKLFKDAPYC